MKRLFDFIVSLTALLILSPMLLTLAMMVSVKFGRPVFFTQIRPGKDARPFRLIKFRSMTNARDEKGELLPNEYRLTKFGKWLRSTSLDEFPELINVLKGDMSLVGPRPLLMEYVALYDDFQRRRMEVKPGITGWAQVNGRNALTWEKKFELDVWYVDNRSFLLDLKILLLTLIRVIKREGITHQNDVAMPRFKGTNNS